jgi:hypothetical protein
LTILLSSCNKNNEDDPITSALLMGEWVSYLYDDIHRENDAITFQQAYLDTNMFRFDEFHFHSYPDYPDTNYKETQELVHITDETIFLQYGEELQILSLDGSTFVFEVFLDEIKDKKSGVFWYRRYTCYRP